MFTLDSYNNIRGTNFAATPANVALIEKLNATGATEDAVRAWTKPAGHGVHELRAIVSYFKSMNKGTTPAPRKVEKTPAPAPAKEQPAKATPAATPATNNADALIAALNNVLKAPALDEDAIKSIIDTRVAAAVEDAIKNSGATRKIEVKTADGTRVVSGTTHKEFEHILTYLANGDNVYMYGPAGTGKTHMAQQLAEALNLDYYYCGQLTQEYQFTGFTDANGRYQETPFYKAWTEGGLFFFDEIDRSFAEVLTKLNGALANGICDFPAPVGVVKKHPNFRCLAAGNTIGRGACGGYVAANALDAASLDRFSAKIKVDYDKRVEDAISEEAAEFVRVMRKAAGLAGLDVILSYRAIQGLAKYEPIFGAKAVIEDTITATLNTDDIAILKHDINMVNLAARGNKYALAFAA